MLLTTRPVTKGFVVLSLLSLSFHSLSLLSPSKAPVAPHCPPLGLSRMMSHKEAAGVNRAAATGWSSVADLLDADPADLATSCEPSRPRLAKDSAFASAVQSAWRDERSSRRSASGRAAIVIEAMGAPLTYDCEEADGTVTELHGFVVRPSASEATIAGNNAVSSPPAEDALLPGIILFHTGAGPQDIFLRWKAESLVADGAVFGDGGCIVLVADLVSDGTGWTWDDDRTRYDSVRGALLSTNAGDMGRPNLRRRVSSALRVLRDQPGVDMDNIAALGWCMGGHPILEISRMDDPGVRAVATFHGVFDGVALKHPPSVMSVDEAGKDGERGSRRRALICSGSDDPFVSKEQLENCRRIFLSNGWDWTLLQLDGARHGFTNPAQDYNTNGAFAYNDVASKKSWDATRDLLKRSIGKGDS